MTNEATRESETELSREIAQRIELVRRIRELPQHVLEDLAGQSRGQISRIESGKRGRWLSVDTVVAIAVALEVDVGWLITGVVPDGKWRPPLGAVQATPKSRSRKTKTAPKP